MRERERTEWGSLVPYLSLGITHVASLDLGTLLDTNVDDDTRHG